MAEDSHLKEIRELLNSLHMCPLEERAAWMQRVEDLLDRIVCHLEAKEDASHG